jgi:hypothetical protein
VDNGLLLDKDIDSSVDRSIALVDRDEEKEASTVVDRRLPVGAFGVEPSHDQAEEESDEEADPLSGDISPTLSEAPPHKQEIALDILLEESEELRPLSLILLLSRPQSSGVI